MAVATTLKLPEPLKARIAPLAEAEGKSPHAWMIEALEERVARCEAYAAFLAEALEAERHMTETGEAYDADEVHAYLKAVVAGEQPDFPKPVKL